MWRAGITNAQKWRLIEITIKIIEFTLLNNCTQSSLSHSVSSEKKKPRLLSVEVRSLVSFRNHFVKFFALFVAVVYHVECKASVT